MRSILPCARLAHGVAADADDALLLPEQAQPLGGLFGEADGTLGVGGGHSFCRDCGLASASACGQLGFLMWRAPTQAASNPGAGQP